MRSGGAKFDVTLARAGRVVGLVGLIALAAKWLLTGASDPGLTAGMGGLYALGQGGEALAQLKGPAGRR
jgi:hypothetical protein